MSIWERRLQRAGALETLWPHAGDLLRFYRHVLEFQRDAAPRMAGPDDLRPELLALLRRIAPAAEGAAGRILAEAWAVGRPHAACPPAVAVLREDLEAVAIRRSLVCAHGGEEAPHPRLDCPSCGEADPAKLPRFTAREIPWIRIDACDACRTYLKAVDVSKEPDAEPVVDELASTPLDVIARERGYAKITPNLAGL
ncbi:MAG TPA: formate dehydrogenase accessory protein FdhE [Planctomycetota bacterium]